MSARRLLKNKVKLQTATDGPLDQEGDLDVVFSCSPSVTQIKKDLSSDQEESDEEVSFGGQGLSFGADEAGENEEDDLFNFTQSQPEPTTPKNLPRVWKKVGTSRVILTPSTSAPFENSQASSHTPLMSKAEDEAAHIFLKEMEIKASQQPAEKIKAEKEDARRRKREVEKEEEQKKKRRREAEEHLLFEKQQREEAQAEQNRMYKVALSSLYPPSKSQLTSYNHPSMFWSPSMPPAIKVAQSLRWLLSRSCPFSPLLQNHIVGLRRECASNPQYPEKLLKEAVSYVKSVKNVKTWTPEERDFEEYCQTLIAGV
eukprot:TRINITY_DN16569_c0_g1_i1.p1 TRINITY_DN16569_c0_g1~~TRINITY_DN16569_c0_g1_i1.p1  ORF type:complete len:323 (+),score=69.54 TRINITY_DN16569_c0_g1_i1:29-970(+)